MEEKLLSHIKFLEEAVQEVSSKIFSHKLVKGQLRLTPITSRTERKQGFVINASLCN